MNFTTHLVKIQFASYTYTMSLLVKICAHAAARILYATGSELFIEIPTYARDKLPTQMVRDPFTHLYIYTTKQIILYSG